MYKKYHRLFKITLSLILLFAIISSSTLRNKYKETLGLNKNNYPVIIIDPGHGGEDGGAIALDNSVEKEYNLKISLKLKSILSLYGFTVIMTRNDDRMTCDEGLSTQRERKISDIHNRLNIMKNHENSIFVSIHQNKFHDSSQSGSQVFYSHKNSASKLLAENIQNSIKFNLQTENRRTVKQSGTEIYLLYHATVPTVLVECGFLSNYDELKLLSDKHYQSRLAFLIADGIIKYFNQR